MVLGRIHLPYVTIAACVVAGCHPPTPRVTPCNPPPSGAPSLLVQDDIGAIGQLAALLLDGRTKLPIKGAGFRLAGQTRMSLSDSTGWARMTDLAPGSYYMRVIGIGFIPVADTVVLSPTAGRTRVYHLFYSTYACEELRTSSPVEEAQTPSEMWTGGSATFAVPIVVR